MVLPIAGPILVVDVKHLTPAEKYAMKPISRSTQHMIEQDIADLVYQDKVERSINFERELLKIELKEYLKQCLEVLDKPKCNCF